MNQKEVEKQVAAKMSDDLDIHDRVIRIQVMVESLVGNGQEGLCAERGREISFLKKFAWMTMGGGGVLLFLFKFVF